MDRRQFLVTTAKTLPAFAFGNAMLSAAGAQTPPQKPRPAYTLPKHLPQKLSIGMFIWDWITMATPGEPYHDLERVMVGLRERGFNAVRADAGLNWCFTADEKPRGEVEFCPWIRGYSDNLSSVNAKGGGRHDVLKRVVHLMELAKKHGIYVILTSWEYQDSSWFVADPKLRAEVMAIPQEKRLMHLARHHDRLLGILKEKNLQENIAFIEVHNEPDFSEIPQGQEGKRLHTEAIAMLRNRHPDVLVSGDYGSHDPSVVPDNVQVYDQHTYAGFYQSLFAETFQHKTFDPANPKKNELLRRLLKDNFVPYDQFMRGAQNIREFWRPIDWLYCNLDNREADKWFAEQYGREKAALEATTKRFFENDGKEAARRGIPAVCDEGGYWYPPLGSTFEVTQPGLSLLELQIDLAIKHGYWGVMPTTYCGPEHPIWQNVEWLRTVNQRFQNG
jgi:nicotinamidase-related amidase